MNKTIIININGTVFHIEEDAYELLRTYMSDVKRHFAYSSDSDEIVTDIENRLAEMFSERLTEDNKQVIILADVVLVTGRMGNVNEFNIDDEDPIIHTGASSKAPKKLFRDSDDRIIGGICSGFAHFLSIEARWTRLLAILSLFLTAGLTIPIYIILWLVVPRAVSRTERMAMKGEPINIQTFKKNFDEEMEGLKVGFGRAHQEARPAIDKLARGLGSVGMFVIKFIGGIIILAGLLGLVALGIGLLTFLGYWNSDQLNSFPFNVVNPAYKSILTLTAFIVLFIPIAGLVMFAIRVIFTRFYIYQGIYFGMLILWLGALGTGVYYASKIGSEFNEEARFSVTSTLKPLPAYYLKLNPDQYLSKEDSALYNIDPGNFRGRIIINSRRGDFQPPRNVTLKIVRAEVNQPTLIQEFSAKGPNFETALATAQRASHRFIQADSLLMFDGTAHLKAGELWRDQTVSMILQIPVNTVLHIEATVNRYLLDYSLWECQPQDAKDDYLSEWLMTSSGLKCNLDTLSVKIDTLPNSSTY